MAVSRVHVKPDYSSRENVKIDYSETQSLRQLPSLSLGAGWHRTEPWLGRPSTNRKRKAAKEKPSPGRQKVCFQNNPSQRTHVHKPSWLTPCVALFILGLSFRLHDGMSPTESFLKKKVSPKTLFSLTFHSVPSARKRLCHFLLPRFV